MSEHFLPLTSFYKGWDGYQQHLVHVLAPLSTEQLALRVAPHLRSIGIVATISLVRVPDGCIMC